MIRAADLFAGPQRAQAAIDIALRCVPSTFTAQQKKLVIVNGHPRFFPSARQKAEEATLAALLQPYRPAAPIAGAVRLSMAFTWPHLKSTPRRRLGGVEPKMTRPDVENVAKGAIDLLVKLRFLEDDAQIAHLVLQKCHGPESAVGIRIQIAPLTGLERP